MKISRYAFWILAVFAVFAIMPPAAVSQQPTPPPTPQRSAAQPAAGAQGSTQAEKHPAMAGSPKHIFFVIPAFNVDYGHKFVPMTAHEKFLEWAEGAYDPIGLGALATESALEHSRTDGFCGYGSGLGAYGKCYASALADGNISSFFGDYLFPSWLHQDPRYFRLGRQASFGARLWYAISRVFIARTDSGGWTFASGATGGTVLAAVTSNLYYPQSERNLGHTFSRVAWDLGGTAIFNVEAEFWPDIERSLKKRF